MCKVPYLKAASIRLHFKRWHDLKLAKEWDVGLPQEAHVRPIRKQKSSMIEEVPAEAPEKLSCTLCPYQVHRDSKFKIHQENHLKSQAAGQDCPKCNYPCLTPFSLNFHLKSKHKVSVYICKICGIDCISSYKLQNHIFNHKIHDGSVMPGTTELLCNICKKTFKNRRALSVHKVSNHSEELELTVFKCLECPKVYAVKQQLFFHVLKDHKKITQFHCEICRYGAINRTLLDKHMYCHKGESFICEHCSATHTSPFTLKAHLRKYHPGSIVSKRTLYYSAEAKKAKDTVKPKEIKCKYCDKILPHKLELKFHLESQHKDLYIHKCNICDKVYMSVASLQLHKKVNHIEKDKAVKCKWCLRRVNHRFYLYNHMKSCTKKPANLAGEKIAIADEDEEGMISDEVNNTIHLQE